MRGGQGYGCDTVRMTTSARRDAEGALKCAACEETPRETLVSTGTAAALHTLREVREPRDGRVHIDRQHNSAAQPHGLCGKEGTRTN